MPLCLHRLIRLLQMSLSILHHGSLLHPELNFLQMRVSSRSPPRSFQPSLLEPALEQPFRKALVSDETIAICRVQNVLDRETFSSLADTVPEFRDAAYDVYGINMRLGAVHRCEQARLVEAFKASTFQAESRSALTPK